MNYCLHMALSSSSQRFEHLEGTTIPDIGEVTSAHPLRDVISESLRLGTMVTFWQLYLNAWVQRVEASAVRRHCLRSSWEEVGEFR